MADDHPHMRNSGHPADDNGGLGRKSLALEAFDLASKAAAIRKEQEWQRRFPTPQARAEADHHELMAEASRQDNDEKREKRLKFINQGWDPARPQPPEFSRHINKMLADALNAWQTEHDTIERLLERALIHTENEHKLLARSITTKPVVQQIEDQRSDLKRAWDEAGVRTKPYTHPVTPEFNKASDKVHSL